jgi:hypothetical protein
VAKKIASRPPSDIPPEVLPKFEAITALTDAFCKEHLNDEYAEMCRRLATALAQRQPTLSVGGVIDVSSAIPDRLC